MAGLFDLTGRVAAITGSSRGVGLAIAGRVAEASTNMVMSSRKAEACDRAVEARGAAGRPGCSVPGQLCRGRHLRAGLGTAWRGAGAGCNAYGATETTSPATIIPPGAGVVRMDSIGQVVPCSDIRVMDPDGREAPPGEDGEPWIAGPMVAPGHWRDAAATEASFAAGCWTSGDIGSVDAEGYVRTVDRMRDMINRGGFKVHPAEIENVPCGRADVVEAAVVGHADSILGKHSVAFIHTERMLSPGEIRAFCIDRIADYKVPGWVIVSEEPLPRNANGKIQKDLLRQRARDHVSANPLLRAGGLPPTLSNSHCRRRRQPWFRQQAHARFGPRRHRPGLQSPEREPWPHPLAAWRPTTPRPPSARRT